MKVNQLRKIYRDDERIQWLGLVKNWIHRRTKGTHTKTHPGRQGFFIHQWWSMLLKCMILGLESLESFSTPPLYRIYYFLIKAKILKVAQISKVLWWNTWNNDFKITCSKYLVTVNLLRKRKQEETKYLKIYSKALMSIL